MSFEKSMDNNNITINKKNIIIKDKKKKIKKNKIFL